MTKNELFRNEAEEEVLPNPFLLHSFVKSSENRNYAKLFFHSLSVRLKISEINSLGTSVELIKIKKDNHMIRTLFLISFLLTSYSTLGQNPSFGIILDSIYPMIQEGRYEEAKSLWVETEKKYMIDPQHKLNFMSFVLTNGDKKFFKKEIVHLMKESGYSLEHSDTISLYSNYLTDQIKTNNLTEWVMKKSKKYYPKWKWNNPTARLVQLEMDYYQSRDQLIIKYAPPICYKDSSCVIEYDKHYEEVARKEMSELTSFCYQIGGIPNNIDHGLGVVFVWQLVFGHCIEVSKENLHYTLNLLQSYIDRAYFDGKIDTSVYYIIDQAYIKFYGGQYFGLFEGVPIFEPENFESRTRKYNF